ncbi:MAG: HPr family phosphocarrier protein [Azospirillaceae bacterium]
MSEEETAEGRVLLTHEVGLHARPSVKLTKLAKTFAAKVEVRAADAEAWTDAKSIVKVMALKVPQGTELEFRAAGADADTAVERLVRLVEADFEEGSGDGGTEAAAS